MTAALLFAGGAAVVGCGGKGAGGSADAGLDASDGGDAGSDALALCTDQDAGDVEDAGGGTTNDAAVAGDAAVGGMAVSVDEFGPNAPAAKMAAAIGRVNVYEVTTPRLLERVDIYLGAALAHTRITIAVHHATSRTSIFEKLKDVQIDVDQCQGWASSGRIAIPLEAGRFYAIGFDPNQLLTAFISTDADSVPVDGAFGRLIGSKTATSVSVPTLTWDKVTDKEYNRQRLATSPRPGGTADAGTVDAGSSDGGASDAGTSDAGKPADAAVGG